MRTITTLDAHTAGEPLRIITGGFPEPQGTTMLERRRWLLAHADPLRRLLMHEPRGHADMYGCLPTTPVSATGDVGALFLHNEGSSTMCGHAIIALVTVGLECGLFAVRDPERIVIDTPAGAVIARAARDGTRVRRVSFTNVPSFVFARDLEVDVPGLGASARPLRCDVAFGGAFYVYVSAADVGIDLAAGSERTPLSEIVAAARAIQAAVEPVLELRHPSGATDLDYLYGVILSEEVAVGDAERRRAARGRAITRRSRNVCVFADGEVDRSPTGTGVSGRIALELERGAVALGEPLVVESLVGTSFTVRATSRTSVGELPAVVPEVSGSAYLTGEHRFFLQPDDPFPGGFLLR
ncbi:MAG: proline racemase [Acidobacteria bacterium]|nr:MAG: proline racemase [Acidobacteriota bacterium]REK03348.1 MAG: proline racemase [Acidobacteriota bacterium]